MATIIINNTSLKDRYNAALREYNCCKSLVGLYPNQYIKPLEKAKKELEAIEREISESATDIIAEAMAKVVEKQQKKAEVVKVKPAEKKQEKPVEKKQEKKEKKESKNDSNSHKEVKSEEQQPKPKEEVKAAKVIKVVSEDLKKRLEEKKKVEDAFFKKYDPESTNDWGPYSMLSDDQVYEALEKFVSSKIPFTEYTRKQMEALLYHVSTHPLDEKRTLCVPRLSKAYKKELDSVKREFTDFDLALRSGDNWVYFNSVTRESIIVPINKKEVKIISEDEAQSEQEVTRPVQMKQPETTTPTVNPDSPNPFLEFKTNPGRLIPGYTAR